MNSRERFIETMRFGRPDHVPYFEEGIRDDVLDRWREQGLAADAKLDELFPSDRRERLPVHIGPLPDLDRSPVDTRDVRALRRRLDPADPRRLPDDWQRLVRCWGRRDHVLELQVHQGFFLSMGVHDWRRFEQAIYLLHDAPAVVHGVMEAYCDLAVGLIQRIARDVQIDFVSFSEPIGGNDRPLLSPRSYREFVLRWYTPILDAIREARIPNAVFITYANARALLPSVVDAGFNGLWACEVNPAVMDYRDIRREFGRRLALIGGIDLDTLLLGEDAVRREMEAKLPPLLSEGGYIPLADGRVRSDVPLRTYARYRQLLREMTAPRVDAPNASPG